MFAVPLLDASEPQLQEEDKQHQSILGRSKQRANVKLAIDAKPNEMSTDAVPTC